MGCGGVGSEGVGRGCVGSDGVGCGNVGKSRGASAERASGGSSVEGGRARVGDGAVMKQAREERWERAERIVGVGAGVGVGR